MPAARPDTSPALPLRYALYRRVSDPDQVEKDLSLPAQRRQQLDFVAKEGGLVAAEYEDGGISGRRVAGREQFLAAIAAAKERAFDVLLIHKSDRVFRNRDDAFVYKGLLKKHGVSLRSVTEDWVGGSHPGEKLLEGLMECINEFYSENLSSEVKKGQREIVVGKGRQNGFAPYGYGYVNPEVQGSGWTPIEEEAAWVRRMFAWFGGGETAADIARRLNAAGVPTYGTRQRGPKPLTRPGAAFWHTTVVQAILTNRCYTGMVRFHDEWFPGVHEPLIPPEAFERASLLVTRRGKGRTEHSEHGLFVGALLHCPHCDSPLTHMRVRKTQCTGTRGGSLYQSRYRCQAAYEDMAARSVGADVRRCPSFAIGQGPALRLLTAYLEKIILEKVIGEAPPAGVRAKKAAALLPLETGAGAGRETRADREARRGTVLAEMSKTARMRQGYIDLAAAGDIRPEEMREALGKLEGRRAAMQAELDAMSAQAEAPPALGPALARDLLGVLSDDARTIRQKRDELRLAIEYIKIWPDRTGLDVVLTL